MAIQKEPTRNQIPFADSGTKNVIPDTNSTPSASQAASWTDGFPAQCSLPLSAGGIPPARADFNGILNTMSQSIRFGQEGGVWGWDATVDYGTNRMVLGSDGKLYWSIAQSGPNVGGAQDPTTDNGTHWLYIVTEQWINSNIAPNILYLDATNGSDSNSGLVEASPLKTFAAAKSKLTGLKSYANNSSFVKLVLLSGDYGSVIYQGNELPPLWFEGRSGATLVELHVTGATQVKITGTIIFNTSSNNIPQLYCASNCYIFGQDCLLTFRGSCSSCIQSNRLSTMLFEGSTLNFDSVSVSDAVARTQDMGLMNFDLSNTVSGTATGKRYNCTNMSELNTHGGGANFFPGTIAGSASSTSLYV